MIIHLPHNFTPRPYQLGAWHALNKGIKRFYLLQHRRSGKDRVALNIVIQLAMQRVGLYLYLFPQQNQVRKAIWKGISADGIPFLAQIPKALIAKINNTDMSVEFINGSILQFAGSNNVDALVGTNPVLIAQSELALQNPYVRTYLSPILAENDGVEIILTTPRGKNHAYELYQNVKNNPLWYVTNLTVEDTKRHDGSPVISQEQINEERRNGMSEEMLRQEFYCFPPEAKVMTVHGLKAISLISQGDLVLTHTGRWRNVDNTISREYTGDMISIISAGSREPIVCTPEHPVRVYRKANQTYEWIAAKDIQLKDYLVYPKISHANEFKTINKELIILMAWYTTEGSCSKTGLNFSLHSGEMEEADEIRLALQVFNIDSKTYKSKNSQAINIVACCTGLVEFLVANCGSLSHNRRIPFSMIQGYEELFFETIMKGDGCKFKKEKAIYETYCYITTSETFAYQFQLLGNTLGYKMSITKVPIPKNPTIQGRQVKVRVKYDIRGTKPNTYEQVQQTPLRLTKYGVASCVNKVDIIPYAGKVYNLSVGHDNSYVVAGRAVHNCDWNVGVQGAYYTTELDRAEKELRIGTFDRGRGPVWTFWDIGVSDSTAIWVMQPNGPWIDLIAYYENNNFGLDHYIRWLEDLRQKWNLNYRSHYAPHDIKQRQWASGARTRLELARELGINFMVTANVGIDDGISAVKSVFERFRFHEPHTKKGIDALREYRREYDEVRRCFHNKPLHDWSSNCADSLRYLAVTYRDLFSRPQSGNLQYKTPEFSLPELDKFRPQSPNVTGLAGNIGK